jgi:catechol 2,3-dioxygenase-like lactoylglutathione lyase family enzyme
VTGTRAAVLLALLIWAAPAPADAQLVAAKDGPIVYGHHHVNASNVEEHKKFWATTLGGTAIKAGTNNLDVIKFPNVLIFMRAQAAKGGSKGTTANHIGISVPNLRQTLDKVRANGYRVVTREEANPTQEVRDDIVVMAPGGPLTGLAFILGPDEVKVELLELKAQTQPAVLHHIHFFGPDNLAMRAWYEKVFGAKPRPVAAGAAFVSSDLPGVQLSFTQSADAVGTAGRAVDHIGFEVKNLEQFTKNLEAQGITLNVTYRKIPALDTAIAFITDPWGTYIELSEGLDRIQ